MNTLSFLQYVDYGYVANPLPGFFAVFIYMLICVPLIVLQVIAQWKVYEKAGQPGWACIVPVYNLIILLKIVGKPWWWMFLLFIPIANVVFMIIIINLLSKSFGKRRGFTVGLVLLDVVFYPILAFGSATYQGPAGLLKK